MKKTNTLPALWYIENKYEEVREYLNTLGGPNTSNWTEEKWKWIAVDGNGTHKGGSNASNEKDPFNTCVKLTIEQFRAHIKSDVVINNYEIY